MTEMQIVSYGLIQQKRVCHRGVVLSTNFVHDKDECGTTMSSTLSGKHLFK